MKNLAALAVTCLLVATTSPAARAEDDDGDKKIAKDLFDRGVTKMEEGKCDQTPIASVPVCTEARELFRRAYQLSPGSLGALRNLAYVERGLGLIASAARSFRELARLAPLDPKPARRAWAEFARKELEALNGRIPHLLLSVKPESKTAGLKVSVDGVAVAEAAWGTQLDVDPGDHAVHAEAPGRLPFDQQVTLVEKSDVTVEVTLVVAPKPAAPPAPAASLPDDKPLRDHRTARIVSLFVVGVGFATTVVGVSFGYSALKKRDASCGADKVCEPHTLDSLHSLARTSTIVTGIGGAVLVGGLVWLLTIPSASSPRAAMVTPYVSQDGAGLAAVGRF